MEPTIQRPAQRLRAFTLIELMIVVAIIGLLSAIAVPNFQKFQCRAKQAEAKAILKAVYVQEQSYFALNDGYAIDDPGAGRDLLDQSYLGIQVRYNFTLDNTPTNIFLARGVGANGDVTLDEWTMNNANQLGNPTNQCL